MARQEHWPSAGLDPSPRGRGDDRAPARAGAGEGAHRADPPEAGPRPHGATPGGLRAYGATQSGMRAYNERLILSMVRRLQPIPGSDLARLTGLSAQTVSVILRGLEADGLLSRGAPQRGRVGKPSVPMTLDASGAFSIGLKIGRRSADLALMDLHGTIREQIQAQYRYPLPETILAFLRSGIDTITAGLTPAERDRVGGIGIAAPFEIWRWHDTVGAPPETFAAWRDTDLPAEIAAFSPLPVMTANDATAACRAENVFGRGPEFRDYAYFFVGSFVGGGVVLNHAVVEGRYGNAGALGSLQSVDARGRSVQLLETASLHLLEAAIAAAGGDPAGIWREPADWRPYADQVGPWIERAGQEIARAALSACAVIDFEAIVIDGALPPDVRDRLVARVRAAVEGLDSRGLVVPRIEAGMVGGNARVVGAAYGPLAARHFLDIEPAALA